MKCKVSGCGKPSHAKSYCSGHYYRMNRYGDPLAGGKIQNRKLKPNSGYITSNGYKKVRDEDGRWILEHRLVMEQALGRELLTDENVHHLDGDKLNNKPDNLELWVRPQPQGVKVEDALAWAREIIRRYG